VIRTRVTMLLVLCASAWACSAMTAVAKEFHGGGEEFMLKSSFAQIKPGKYLIGCQSATLTGIAPLPSSNTLRGVPSYTKCERELAKAPAEVKTGTCQYELHSSETSKVTLSIVPANCLITISIPKQPLCKIRIRGGQKELMGSTVTEKIEELKLAMASEISWISEGCAELEESGKQPDSLTGVFEGTGVSYG
jgi:hypothetical protein